jgi:hypothetical protein
VTKEARCACFKPIYVNITVYLGDELLFYLFEQLSLYLITWSLHFPRENGKCIEPSSLHNSTYVAANDNTHLQSALALRTNSWMARDIFLIPSNPTYYTTTRQHMIQLSSWKHKSLGMKRSTSKSAQSEHYDALPLSRIHLNSTQFNISDY